MPVDASVFIVNLMINIEIVCQYFVIFVFFTPATDTLACLLTAHIFLYFQIWQKNYNLFFTENGRNTKNALRSSGILLKKTPFYF